jgi:pimeloyl-ACP methyl ester carboxylesterase
VCVERVAVVFVHGLFSSARAWSVFRSLIQADRDLTGIDLFDFEYPSPKSGARQAACARLEAAFEEGGDGSSRLLLIRDWPLTGARDEPR